MTIPFKLHHLKPETIEAWLKTMPEGDYTIGRGADPRGPAERATDAIVKTPAGKTARSKSAKRKPARPEAAE
jgi:hypothetical protein